RPTAGTAYSSEPCARYPSSGRTWTVADAAIDEHVPYPRQQARRQCVQLQIAGLSVQRKTGFSAPRRWRPQALQSHSSKHRMHRKSDWEASDRNTVRASDVDNEFHYKTAAYAPANFWKLPSPVAARPPQTHFSRSTIP